MKILIYIVKWLVKSYVISFVRRLIKDDPAGIYVFKVTNRNTRKRCEICSKLTIKTPERRHLMFLLLTFNMQFQAGEAAYLFEWSLFKSAYTYFF